LEKDYLFILIHFAILPSDDLIDIWHVIFPLNPPSRLLWRDRLKQNASL